MLTADITTIITITDTAIPAIAPVDSSSDVLRLSVVLVLVVLLVVLLIVLLIGNINESK